MGGNERRKKLLEMLNAAREPLSGAFLARAFSVSRQIIVQDIMLLRSAGADIISTHRGYIVNKKNESVRVFKVKHSDEDTEKELSIIVDLGGRVQDVFIYHRVYNVVRAKMNIRSRRDLKLFLENIRAGKSSFLKNATSGYHYHTVAAESERILDAIGEELSKAGFFAELQDDEPFEII